MTALPIGGAVDNDIVLKSVSYGLSRDFWPDHGTSMAIGVLGAARYVIGNRLKRSTGPNIGRAQAELDNLLAAAHEFEPSVQEIQLAAALEESAQEAGLALDVGESQLAAIAVERRLPRLDTGDKRAIAALETLRARFAALDRLDGIVRCLEQVVLGLFTDGAAFARVTAAICANSGVDKTLDICLACHSPARATQEQATSGLTSYIRDLRSKAPCLLTA